MPKKPAKPDPILKVLDIDSLPPSGVHEDMLKHTPESESAAGSPEAGKTTLDVALKKGPWGILQVLGPGLVTGASDDDPSGIGTYSQAGSQFGYSLLWTALLSFPLMIAVQELCARIALHTGVGLGVSLKRKFPAWLVGICILALFAANTINVGADLGAITAGMQLLSGNRINAIWLILPVAIMLILFQLFSTYPTIFKIFKWLTLALFCYVITVFFSHPALLEVLKNTIIPHIIFSKDFIGMLVAILGTTISPYLFFWQASSEVEEMKEAGLTTRAKRRGVKKKELKAARIDIFIGMLFSQVVMYCIILTTAATLNVHGVTNIQSAQDAAQALQPLAGQYAEYIFGIGLIGTGLLAIPILSGSATYALKEFLNFGGSLAFKPKYKPTFYAVLTLSILIGAGLNFLGINPISALFITALINGLIAPPILVLINLLGSDKKVMGSAVSGNLSKTFGWLATGIMWIAAIALIITTVIH